MPLEILEVHFDCAGPQRRVLLTTALSLWRRAHFRTWWSLFVAGAVEKPRVLVLQSRLFVTVLFVGIGAVLVRNAVFVAGAALWTWR